MQIKTTFRIKITSQLLEELGDRALGVAIHSKTIELKTYESYDMHIRSMIPYGSTDILDIMEYDSSGNTILSHSVYRTGI